ncbi:hypothetical protein M1446_00290 [Candidatus Dependentiae bacterium]|nr:hypothetical protein [Candidatus Dependentiae bacterium]
MKKLLLSTLLILGFLPTTQCSAKDYLAGIGCGIVGVAAIAYGIKQIKKGFKAHEDLKSPYLGLFLTTIEEKNAQKQDLIQKRTAKYTLGFVTMFLGADALYMAKNFISSKTV